jgi:hypothetical protein
MSALRFVALLAFLSACRPVAPLPDLGPFVTCDPAQGVLHNPACPPDAPQCDESANLCVGCIPSSQTCPAGYACSQDSRTCVRQDTYAPCKRDVDCPAHFPGANHCNIRCDLTNGGWCVECIKDDDCVDPATGGVGQCVLSTHTCAVDYCNSDAGAPSNP